MPPLNPFRKVPEEEKRSEADARKLQTEHINEAIKAAKLCVDSPLFKSYEIKYERVREELRCSLETLEETDPVQFYVKARALQTHIRTLGALLADVKKDAERKIVQ